jgi:hypothetical protein
LTGGGGSAVALTPLSFHGDGDTVTEAEIQALVHAHPECLPITEIDPMFSGPVAICTELKTLAGPIDIFMVTPSGLPVLVECKLWRNPEGRREVVGQILDYAKELSRWSSSDLQREVSRCLKRDGSPLLEMVRAVDPGVSEIEFNDALTANLRHGRFLLLIVGDGIREGVEAIAEYLQRHAGLHFSLGLVELPIYLLPNGDRLVAPRVLARATIVTRNVVALPHGYALEEAEDPAGPSEIDPDRSAQAEALQRFWREFLDGYLKLDDPEQQIPSPARQGQLNFMLPAQSGSSWLTVYRNMKRGEVGVTLSYHRDTAGDYARQAIIDEWDAVKDQLGGTAKVIEENGRSVIRDFHIFGELDRKEVRGRAFAWLAERVNTFVNVMRPRVRSAAANFRSGGEHGITP